MTTVMNKRDYFLHAMAAQCYRHKAWVLEAFASVEKLDGSHKTYPYALTRHENGSYSFKDPHSHEEVILEGTFLKGAPFQFLEEITVGPGDLPNVKETVVTCYGNVLVNSLCLVYPFGDRIPFQTGPMKVSKMESLVEPLLVDSHTPKERWPKNAITIPEFKRFNESVRHLEGFSQLCVPSASAKTMTVSPEVIKRRNELIKEHRHELNDPLVQAKIDKELIAMEKAWMKGDPGERFYIKDKSYDVVRKRLFLAVGQEKGFGHTGDYIPTSLSEGWRVKDIPSMATALRDGSYSRGAWTAMGGVEAKNNYRIFQNTVVAEEDCGSPLGLRLTIPKKHGKLFISSSVIEKDGKVVELTDENIGAYVDKPVTLRSVAFCKTADQNVCATCVGKKIAQTPNAISTYCSDLGSTFLSLSLKAMHGSALKIATFDYLACLG